MSVAIPRLKLKQRVLIADSDSHFARRMADYLWDNGCEARVVHTVTDAKGSIQSWQPHAVFVNLIIPAGNALSLMKFINSKNIRTKPAVTVMSKRTMPVALDEVRKAGVRFTLLKPFPLEDALRIVEIVGQQTAPAPAAQQTVDGSMRELHLLNLILKQATIRGGDDRLYNLLRMINIKVDGLRSSLIQWVNPDRGIVVASNDDENARGLAIDMKSYPEIQTVRMTGRHLIIPNVRTSDILAPVQSKLAQTPFETIVLFPVHKHGAFFGVLSLRMLQKDPVKMFYIEKFGEVCSHILALSIHHPELPIFKE